MIPGSFGWLVRYGSTECDAACPCPATARRSGGRESPYARLPSVSHPSLGLPPLDLTAGFPEAAARLRANTDHLAARALAVAMDADTTLRDRYDETGQRQLLRDATLLAERIAVCVAAANPRLAHDYGEWTAPLYRRRRVPMDDLVALCEGLRAAFPSVLAPAELASASAALDAAIEAYRWHRRLAGDARRKNPFLQFLYKGG
jgi:hypothetical protein